MANEYKYRTSSDMYYDTEGIPGIQPFYCPGSCSEILAAIRHNESADEDGIAHIAFQLSEPYYDETTHWKKSKAASYARMAVK